MNWLPTILRSVLLLGLLAGPLSSQRLYVRTSAPSGGDGSSWARAFDDLQPALVAAAGNPSVTEVWVAAGRYLPASADRTATFLVPDGVALYGGFAGTETALDQRDLVVNVTLLDGDLSGDDQPNFVNYGDNSWHVVTASGVQSFALDGFTVRGGSRSGGAGIAAYAEQADLANLVVKENWGESRGFNDHHAAGLKVVGQRVSMRACRFSDNESTSGAGVSLLQPLQSGPTQATFEGCSFERNVADVGGALMSSGDLGWDITLSHCSFRACEARFGGAGVRVSKGELTVLDCVFEDNTAQGGGGISFAPGSAPDGTARIARCTFAGNVATTGGGIFLENHVTAVIESCDFKDNSACSGGGIASGLDTLRVERCRFEGNRFRGGCGGVSTSTGGGGIWAFGTTLEIVDSSFANDELGSLWLEYGGDASVASSSFANDAVAALHVQDGSLQLDDCIAWGAVTPQVVLGPSGSVAASYSDIGMGGAGLPGTGNMDVDPLFADAPAGDLHLAGGSPCIDAGDPGRTGAGADFEQDSRLLDGDLDGSVRIDLGADEHAPLHLEILGVPAPGNTLTLVSSGPPGLGAVLSIGSPGARYFPQVGTSFISLAGAIRTTWPAPPSSVSVPVPPALAGLGLFHVQELGFGGGAFALSNYVPLRF